MSMRAVHEDRLSSLSLLCSPLHAGLDLRYRWSCTECTGQNLCAHCGTPLLAVTSSAFAHLWCPRLAAQGKEDPT